MPTKFNNNIIASRANTIAKADVVDLDAYRKIRVSNNDSHVIVLSADSQVGCAISRVLSSIGTKVEVVSDALTFSRIFQRSSFDVVFLDRDIEWVSASELSGIIRQYGRYTEIPIALLTDEDGTEESQEDIMQGYFDGVLQKPINARNLISMVENFLNSMNKTIDSN